MRYRARVEAAEALLHRHVKVAAGRGVDDDTRAALPEPSDHLGPVARPPRAMGWILGIADVDMGNGGAGAIGFGGRFHDLVDGFGQGGVIFFALYAAVDSDADDHRREPFPDPPQVMLRIGIGPRGGRLGCPAAVAGGQRIPPRDFVHFNASSIGLRTGLPARTLVSSFPALISTRPPTMTWLIPRAGAGAR